MGAEVQNAPNKAELDSRSCVASIVAEGSLSGLSQPTKVQPFFLLFMMLLALMACRYRVIRLCIFLGLLLFSGGDTPIPYRNCPVTVLEDRNTAPSPVKIARVTQVTA